MSTWTSELGLTEPTPGDPAVSNAWGTLLNSNFAFIDTAIAGLLPLDVSGNSNVALTFANGSVCQARNRIFSLIGTITGDINVLWPNGKTGFFLVKNGTSGGFTLSLAVDNGSGAPAGAAVAIPQGYGGVYYTDGTNVYSAVDIHTLLVAPLPVALGGTGNTTGQPSGAAGGDLSGNYPSPSLANGSVTVAKMDGSARVLNSQVFNSNGTFTVPDGATADTVFKFTVTGGGGGASKAVVAGTPVSGGAGGTGILYASGLTAAATIPVVVGTGGAGTASGNASNGNNSTITIGATTYTAHGGTGGSSSSGPAGGTVSGFSINAPGGFGMGGTGVSYNAGGSSYWGGGGAPGSGGTVLAGFTGDSGHDGIVVVEWVL